MESLTNYIISYISIHFAILDKYLQPWLTPQMPFLLIYRCHVYGFPERKYTSISVPAPVSPIPAPVSPVPAPVAPFLDPVAPVPDPVPDPVPNPVPAPVPISVSMPISASCTCEIPQYLSKFALITQVDAILAPKTLLRVLLSLEL